MLKRDTFWLTMGIILMVINLFSIIFGYYEATVVVTAVCLAIALILFGINIEEPD